MRPEVGDVACLAVGDLHAVELPVAVVPEEVTALQRRQPGVMHDHASDHGAAPAAVVVVIDRRDGVHACLRGRVGDRPLEARPAEVVAAGVAGDVVDLLPFALAGVADVEITGDGVDPEPPRVAEAVVPDLATGAGLPDERIRPRDRVRVGRGRVKRIDAEDVAEQVVECLRERARRVDHPRVAVADGDVEVAVGAELEHPGVVVLPRLDDLEDLPWPSRDRPDRGFRPERRYSTTFRLPFPARSVKST